MAEIKKLGYKVAPNNMVILHQNGEIVCEIKDSPSDELFAMLTLICCRWNSQPALLEACESTITALTLLGNQKRGQGHHQYADIIAEKLAKIKAALEAAKEL